MTTELDKGLQRLKKGIDRREKEKNYQFPLWPEDQRTVPNELVRSALFSARKGEGSELQEDVVIFSQKDITISYTGRRLTQDHLDVFEAVMHIARCQKEDSCAEFTAKQLLQVLGRSTGGREYERVTSTFRALANTLIKVRSDRKTYWGSLLPSGLFDEKTGVYSVEINRRLIKFFEVGFTRVEHKQRKKLGRSPLAKFLHTWLASHRMPYPVSVKFLYQLSGSDAKELYHFRAQLKIALDKLVDVDVLASWEIDINDKVHFFRAKGVFIDES